MTDKKLTRETIRRDLEIIFEPIFSREDDTVAAYLPLEGRIQWHIDRWCGHVYNKFKQLHAYFDELNLPFVSFERFVILALVRTLEHEHIHGVESEHVDEKMMNKMCNNLFTERLIDEILETVRAKIERRIRRIKSKENHDPKGWETFLAQNRRRCRT